MLTESFTRIEFARLQGYGESDPFALGRLATRGDTSNEYRHDSSDERRRCLVLSSTIRADTGATANNDREPTEFDGFSLGALSVRAAAPCLAVYAKKPLNSQFFFEEASRSFDVERFGDIKLSCPGRLFAIPRGRELHVYLDSDIS